MILMALVSTALSMPLARLMLVRSSERELIGAAVAPAPDHGT
jgi:hypothetical protein